MRGAGFLQRSASALPTAAVCAWAGIVTTPLTTESRNQVRVSSNRPDSERLMTRHVWRNGRIHARRRSRSATHERGFAHRDLRASFPMQRFGSALATSCRLSYLDESARQRLLAVTNPALANVGGDVSTLPFSMSSMTFLERNRHPGSHR
jgi:hypothetical protein